MIINQQKLYLSSPGSALTAVASALGHGPFGRLPEDFDGDGKFDAEEHRRHV